MLKMQLVGVNAEQEALLNALHETCAVELKRTDELFEGSRCECDKSEIIQKRESVEQALSLITKTAGSLGIKDILADGFGVSYSEFVEVYTRESEILQVAKSAKEKREKTLALGAKNISLKTELSGYIPYQALEVKFSDFRDTALTSVRFGIATDNALRKITEGLINQPLATLLDHGKSLQGTLIAVVCHESVLSEVDRVLGESGFIKCPFKEDISPKDKIAQLEQQIEQNEHLHHFCPFFLIFYRFFFRIFLQFFFLQ